jgi:hypothetical protein
MPDISRSTARALAATLGAAAALTLSGCNAVGPASLSAGRGVYNDVLNRTEDEQVLNMIVRLRYGETFGMLSVASVTASIRAAAGISSDIGIGPDENFAGNLVPLGIEGAYEENPTISYIPLNGEQFMVDLLTPLTTAEAFLITRSAPGDQVLLRTLVSRANGLSNSASHSDETSGAFNRVVEITQQLQASRKMSTIAEREEGGLKFAILFYNYSGEDTPLVEEYLRLLGLTAFTANGDDLRIPIRAALGRPDGASINIELRSIYDLIIAAGQAIEIPPDHLRRNIVEPMPDSFTDSPTAVRIRSSRSRPSEASVAIPFEGQWFFIDRTDHASKQRYLMLRTLIGLRLQDSSSNLKAPALTIGVGG